MYKMWEKMELVCAGTLILIIALIVACTINGCKDSEIAQIKSLGSRHKITQYGCDGKIINQWESTGNVSPNSDGWYFKDTKTGKLIEVSGTLVIEQE